MRVQDTVRRAGKAVRALGESYLRRKRLLCHNRLRGSLAERLEF
jgi:hypothetical protein